MAGSSQTRFNSNGTTIMGTLSGGTTSTHFYLDKYDSYLMLEFRTVSSSVSKASSTQQGIYIFLKRLDIQVFQRLFVVDNPAM